MARSPLALLLLAACAPVPLGTADKPEESEHVHPEDLDGDGVPASDDCDDSDPTAFPGNPEVCDGVDNDCDGEVDEQATDAPTVYADADGDGHGDPAAPISACEPPAGTAEAATDCDDADPGRYPGAPERCNGVDDDCDGSVDEEAEDALLFYADADGDGHGDPGAPLWACALPEGAAPTGTDCDDADPTAFPGAPELCDGADNDCDTAVDEGYDADGDGLTPCAGDCDDTDARVRPGLPEVCDTIDNDCDGVADNGGVCPCAVEHWPDPQHPYLYCETATDWASADAACAAYGYRLVTFDSAAEGSWVEATVLAYTGNYWWVGFTDAASEGNWGWTDGSPVTYLNWSSGEPNNSHGGECVATSEEDCAMIRWSGASWNDYPCACAWPSYVCEGDSEFRPQE